MGLQVQALVESGLKDEFGDVFAKAHDYVDISQIQINHHEHDRYYRDETKGKVNAESLACVAPC